MSKNVEVIKKCNQEAQTAPPLSDFQIGRARVETQHAFKTIEMNAQMIPTTEFKEFLQTRLREVSNIIAAV